MLDIGLCMSVRDEAQHIVLCLAGIADQFAEIVVIDTGSSDETCTLLRDELGIEPMLISLDPARCGSLADARNQGFDRLQAPWLMTLDADERIDPAELAAVIALDERDLPAGLFCAWDTDFGDGVIVEDYKLNLFRAPHRHMGLIHDTAQPSLRLAGEVAEWQSLMRLQHYPGMARREAKDQTYNWRLDCAMECEPDWLRYQWFAGYTAQRRGELDVALPLLRQLHHARPKLFPVESLNASMVLAGLAAQQGQGGETLDLLEDAAAYLASVASDFEVRVNFRLAAWIEAALAAARAGDYAAVRPYLFPY